MNANVDGLFTVKTVLRARFHDIQRGFKSTDSKGEHVNAFTIYEKRVSTPKGGRRAVSYTHLTLPTICSV